MELDRKPRKRPMQYENLIYAKCGMESSGEKTVFSLSIADQLDVHI